MNLQSALDALKRSKAGAKRAFGEGREDHREALKRGRQDAGLEPEGTRIGQMMGTNRTVTLMRELMGLADKKVVDRRKEMGLGIPEDRAERIGYILGTLGADIVQDRGRNIYWLLNAPQATANVVQDVALNRTAGREIFGSKPYLDKEDNQIQSGSKAYEYGIANSEGDPKKGYFRAKDGYRERNYEPGHIDLLAIPAGIAVNSSIGLLNPFGGQEGYKAVMPDEEDPTKTTNVLGEVAAKYILGRTGGLLNWDDFKEVRPDVSKDEYMRYKAFKYDNDMDLNPMDGDLVAPGGILKYTNEGIHGPEVQFLGRSLPLATGILPTAAAIAGTAYGAKYGAGKGNARGRGVRGGLIGGLGSLAASTALGNTIENERRKRNKAENERNQIGTIGM